MSSALTIFFADKKEKFIPNLCVYGGIGRHWGFKIPCFMRIGSSPIRRTKNNLKKLFTFT